MESDGSTILAVTVVSTVHSTSCRLPSLLLPCSVRLPYVNPFVSPTSTPTCHWDPLLAAREQMGVWICLEAAEAVEGLSLLSHLPTSCAELKKCH